MIIWALCYVIIGVANYVTFLAEGKAMFGYASPLGVLGEAAFFIFVWPVQLLFGILVAINSASEWLLAKLFN